MDVIILSTEGLGDRTYIVHDGSKAMVVDPQRDIDRIEELITDLGVTLTVVAETHIHNDYVTGGLALAERSGSRYLVSAEDAVSFRRVPVHDGDELVVGALHLRILKTPGHTPNHLSYVVRDVRQPEQPAAVFTGGSLLYGSVGRTDLVDQAQTLALTGLQYQSVRRLGEGLPNDTSVFPTHGFGSFCSAGETVPDDSSTIGREKTRNDVFTSADEQTFVKNLLDNVTAYPAYYAYMATLNLAGPALPNLTAPEPIEPTELQRRLHLGEWAVDVRNRKAFAANHIDGAVSIELGDQFAIYLGWILPWGSPVTLIGESHSDIATAQRQLTRIGIDHLAGAAAGPFDEIGAGLRHRSYPRVDFAHVPAALGEGEVILDVRRADERVRGSIEGSLHIPLTELLDRIGELPQARLWVHCGSGFRAGIAASLLDRAHRPVVHIDDFYVNAPNRGATWSEETIRKTTMSANNGRSAGGKAMYKELRVPTAAGELYVRDYAGSGPAFVMLHGFPDNLGIFDKIAPLVAASGRRVVVFDFLGFGDSDKPGEGYSFGQQAGDVLAVADALDLDRIIPVGHDAGGAVAVNFTLNHRERTAEVALLNCFYGSSPSLRFPELILFFATPGLAALNQHFLRAPARFAEILEFQRSKFREVLGSEEQVDYDEFLAPLIDENFSRQGSGPAFAHMTAQLLPEVAREDQNIAELEKLEIPFRLIWGAEDPYLVPAVAEDISKHLRHATTTILSGAGHWPQIDRPTDVTHSLLSDADTR